MADLHGTYLPGGIEFVSPIYLAEPTFSWAADLSTIFGVLHASFLISPSPHCSTHVHLSGYPAPLSGAELAALAKAALYHERALDSLVPPGRRGGWSSSSSFSSSSSSSSSSASSASSSSYWCQSNRANPSLASLPLATCLSVIDNAAAFDDGIVAGGGGSGRIASVVETMNLFPAASAYARAHGKTADFVRGKVYKWNMEGMMSGGGGKGLGTVEFRQPPGSLTAEDAAGWVMLAVSFAAGALVVGPGLGVGAGMTGMMGMMGVEAMGAEEGGSMEELWALLGAGAGSLGWEGLGPVEGIFARRGGF